MSNPDITTDPDNINSNLDEQKEKDLIDLQKAEESEGGV